MKHPGVLIRFRELAAAIGFRDAFLYGISRICGTFSGNRVRLYKYYFVAQPITLRKDQPDARPGSFQFAWVKPGAPILANVARPPAVINARFDQGAECLVATTKDAQFAGFLWVVVGPYDEDEVRIRFQPRPEGQAAWDFDVAIEPRYRLGRLFSQLWNRAMADLGERGVRHTMSRISAFNAASLASHRRLGANVVGAAAFLCVGNWQLMRSSIQPKWHFSWRTDQRPSLSIESGTTPTI